MGLRELQSLLEQYEGSDTALSSDSDKPLLIVVDDDADMLVSLEYLLKASYRVLTFQSPADAVAAVTDEIAAVILDVKMKGHDGFWACDAIRAKNQHLPVIFFSAYQNIKDPF